MKPLPFTVNQYEFFEFLSRSGVGVEVYNYDVSELDISDSYSLCMEAAIHSIRDQLIENEVPTAERQSFEEFLGIGYDILLKVRDNGGYLSRSANEDGKPYFTILVDGKWSMIPITNGLVYVLTDQPYSMRSDNWSSDERARYTPNSQPNIDYTMLVNDFLDIFLGTKIESPHSSQIIYRWSNNWSTYFKMDEWWGAFFWTILDQESNKIIVIASCMTD